MVNVLSPEDRTFLHAIADEGDVVQQFVDVLKVEQTALASGDTDVLPELADKKGQLAVQISQLAEQRNAILMTLGSGVDRSGIENWCALHPTERLASDAWARILTLASEARELNRLNGELIQLRMSANAKALEALRAGKDSLDLYGPDGQSAKPGQRRIDHAV